MRPAGEVWDNEDMGLPMHGAGQTELPSEPPDAQGALEEAMAAPMAEREAALKRAVADHPTLLDGWARLAELAMDGDRPVDAYAYARVGYHRGLDRARQSGWKGQGAVPGSHEPNRGFLRSVWMLGRAAGAIGEQEEAERCETFLRELDPDDGLGVR